MKYLVLFLAAIALMSSLAMAQQDPRDPGLQDSLIIERVVVDSGQTSAFLRVWAVTDDSVAFYNTPVALSPQDSTIHLGNVQYFPPITTWDLHYDTLLSDEGFLRMFGIEDLGDTSNIHNHLYTNYQRVNVWILRVVIPPDWTGPSVIIDTVNDNIDGSLLFGLPGGIIGFTPAFQYGELIFPANGINNGDAMPESYFLSQNYPNPFNSSTNIEFDIPKSAYISLEVYDILGRRVRKLLNADIDPGRHSITWDGKNDLGNDVPSGIYFCKLTTSNIIQTRKMVLMR